MFDEFATKGPTEEEVETAKKQFANILDEQMREPNFWSGKLSTLDYRGLKLDDVLAGPGVYQAFTGEQVKEAFNRYYKPASRFEIHVAPEASAEKSPAKDDAPATPPGASEPPVHAPQPGQHPQGPAVDPAPPMPK
jgi:predicted Zn-dependent peptidase